MGNSITVVVNVCRSENQTMNGLLRQRNNDIGDKHVQRTAASHETTIECDVHTAELVELGFREHDDLFDPC